MPRVAANGTAEKESGSGIRDRLRAQKVLRKNALAYADDMVFIKDTEERLGAMLRILEDFCQ
jgi:hypothetical protein